MRRLVLALIKAYRFIISPLFGNCCRFYPSCSQYAETAVQRHGVIKGSALAGYRVLRCNPWNAGGVDHVPGHCADTKTHSHQSDPLTASTK